MALYRLYFYGWDRHITQRRDFDLPDSDAAFVAAREAEHAYKIEVWTQHRLLGTVIPKGASRRLVPVEFG